MTRSLTVSCTTLALLVYTNALTPGSSSALSTRLRVPSRFTFRSSSLLSTCGGSAAVWMMTFGWTSWKTSRTAASEVMSAVW